MAVSTMKYIYTYMFKSYIYINYLFFFTLGIVHRDLKPQNIVFPTKGNMKDIKIIDFGMSKRGMKRTMFGRRAVQTACGTPLYVAPELVEGARYDEKIDIWAIGVLAYQMYVFPKIDLFLALVSTMKYLYIYMCQSYIYSLVSLEYSCFFLPFFLQTNRASGKHPFQGKDQDETLEVRK